MEQVNGHYSLNGRVLCRTIEDEAVLLDLDSGQYYGLNTVGARIWELLGDGHSASSICEVVVQEFEVSEAEAAADVEAFLTALLGKGILLAKGKARVTG